MADNTSSSETPEGEIVSSDSGSGSSSPRPQMTEAMQATIMQLFGEQEPYKPSKAQVDKMLALEEKGMDYMHKERTMWQPRQIAELVSFVLVLLFVIGLIWIILSKAPEYTGEVISVIVGLVGGGLGGYGYGTKKSGRDE